MECEELDDLLAVLEEGEGNKILERNQQSLINLEILLQGCEIDQSDLTT